MPPAAGSSIDPEAALVDRAIRETGERVAFGCVADTHPAGEALIRRGARSPAMAWFAEARALLLTDRPAAWATLASKTPGKLHPIEVFRALKPYVEADPDTVLICDGGEFAQWGQSVLPVVPRRMINGVGGSIGSSLPMAVAARVVEPDGAGVRGAGRRHVRLPHGGVRNRGALQPAVRRGGRHRCALERRIQPAGPRLRPEPHASAASCCRPATTSWWRRWADMANWWRAPTSCRARSNARWPAASPPAST